MATVATFPLPNPADPQNERQFRDLVAKELNSINRRLQGGAPEISTALSRSGSVVTATHTITDPSNSFLSMEFQFNAGGWVTTWDTVVTGSSYIEAITLTPGNDAIYEIRLGYANENGQRKYKQQAFNLADLQSVTKTIRFPHTLWQPEASTIGWTYGAGAIATTDVATERVFQGALIFPAGVIVTDWTMRATRADGTNDKAQLVIRKINDSGTSISTLLTLTHSGTGYNDTTDSTDETISNDHTYVGELHLKGNASGPDAQFCRLECTYTVASYDKTY